MKTYNTTTPYKILDYKGIQYTSCYDYSHISRYSRLRQLIHNPDDEDRFISLESDNPFTTNAEVIYYTVPVAEENRLDLIAEKFLGSATYSWVIAKFNEIPDGYSVFAGQRLQIPKSVTALFDAREMLAPVSAFNMNLGTE